MRVWDNEGELIVTLSDVFTEEDLRERLAKEDQKLLSFLKDTPAWSQVVDESKWKGKEEGIAQIEMPYAQWIKKCLDWSRSYIRNSIKE